MPTNPTDPFDSIPVIVMAEQEYKTWIPPSTLKTVRLVSEPAMRRAVVAALKAQAEDEELKGDRFSGAESLRLFATRFEGKQRGN